LGRLRPGALCNQRLWAGPQEAGVGAGSTNQKGVMAAQGFVAVVGARVPLYRRRCSSSTIASRKPSSCPP